MNLYIEGKKILLTFNLEIYFVLGEKGKAGRPPKVDKPFLEYFSRTK